MDKEAAAAEARRQAAAEGLTLERSDGSSSGFRMVAKTKHGYFAAQISVPKEGQEKRKLKSLGSFHTAEEVTACPLCPRAPLVSSVFPVRLTGRTASGGARLRSCQEGRVSFRPLS